jgi:predicted DNA-binding protein
MTKVLTVRIPPGLLRKAEARAARIGLDRAKYVRNLIEEDVASEKSKLKHKFASEDLIGCYEGDGRPATNAVVREKMRQHGLAKRER